MELPTSNIRRVMMLLNYEAAKNQRQKTAWRSKKLRRARSSFSQQSGASQNPATSLGNWPGPVILAE